MFFISTKGGSSNLGRKYSSSIQGSKLEEIYNLSALHTISKYNYLSKKILYSRHRSYDRTHQKWVSQWIFSLKRDQTCIYPTINTKFPNTESRKLPIVALFHYFLKAHDCSNCRIHKIFYLKYPKAPLLIFSLSLLDANLQLPNRLFLLSNMIIICLQQILSWEIFLQKECKGTARPLD